MAGYTPVFDSVFNGTLCGRWPTLPVWLTILPMADKHGQIDMTYQAISALTGWPVDLLKQAMAELSEPDPESRSGAHDGRRLVLIDPDNRSWGWQVVNHEKYREKARKSAYDADRTQSGKDRDRKAAERETSRDIPTRPAPSRAVPLSDSDSDSDSDKSKRGEGALARATPPPLAEGLDPEAWDAWTDYRRKIRKPLKPVSVPAAQLALAAFGCDQAAVVEQSIANGWQGLFALKTANGAHKPVDPVRTWRPEPGDDETAEPNRAYR